MMTLKSLHEAPSTTYLPGHCLDIQKGDCISDAGEEVSQVTSLQSSRVHKWSVAQDTNTDDLPHKTARACL